LARTNGAITPDEVTEVIMGQVLTANEGQNPARQAARGAGLSYTIPAITINMVCGSGLKAVILGAQAIKTGDAIIVIAGGQESMSQAPHCISMRQGKKMGDATLVDSILHDV
jgi:acetyl-CoA C-acetyltransferase